MQARHREFIQLEPCVLVPEYVLLLVPEYVPLLVSGFVTSTSNEARAVVNQAVTNLS